MQINAFLRYNIGTKANKRLRNNSIIPAIIYGGKKPNSFIALDKEQLFNFIKQDNFVSSILYLNVKNNKEKVIIKTIHRHPFKHLINHIDFFRINNNQKLNVLVKIKVIGKEFCKAIKEEGGSLFLHTNFLRINCLPKYLPNFISINVSHLNLGQSFMFHQLAKTKHILFLEKNPHKKILTIKRSHTS